MLSKLCAFRLTPTYPRSLLQRLLLKSSSGRVSPLSLVQKAVVQFADIDDGPYREGVQTMSCEEDSQRWFDATFCGLQRVVEKHVRVWFSILTPSFSTTTLGKAIWGIGILSVG